jgi:hypothetical protein
MYRLEIYGMDDGTCVHTRDHNRHCLAVAAFNLWSNMIKDGVCKGVRLVDVFDQHTLREAGKCPIA